MEFNVGFGDNWTSNRPHVAVILSILQTARAIAECRLNEELIFAFNGPSAFSMGACCSLAVRVQRLYRTESNHRVVVCAGGHASQSQAQTVCTADFISSAALTSHLGRSTSEVS
eukprot:scaffold90312_cov35-Tisochrysis_lutea.AAC.2